VGKKTVRLGRDLGGQKRADNCRSLPGTLEGVGQFNFFAGGRLFLRKNVVLCFDQMRP